jgi:hypothetical protein
MSRDALNNTQFDLLVATEREHEQKQREDRAGIQKHVHTPSPTGTTFYKQGRRTIGTSTCSTCEQKIAKGGSGPSGWYTST